MMMDSKSFVIDCDGVKLQEKLDFPKEEKEKYPTLYVADATILPESMGNPPILTIMALAKKISKVILQSDQQS